LGAQTIGMKELFAMTVLLENAGAAAAALAVLWLQDRWHRMTGPHEQVVIHGVMLLAVICSFSALLLGFLSLGVLRVLKNRGEDLSSRKAWAWLSLLISVALILFSLLPIRTG
jgi:hypothetical protein